MTLGLVVFAAPSLYAEEIAHNEVLSEKYEEEAIYDEAISEKYEGEAIYDEAVSEKYEEELTYDEIFSEKYAAKEEEQEIIALGLVDHGHSFITKGELRDVNNVPQIIFGYYDTIKAYFEYQIPDGLAINAGDTMTVVIPTQLRFSAGVSFDIFDNDGHKSGTGVVNPIINTITITFTDYYETRPLGRGGNFYVWLAWDRSEVEVGEIFPIRIPYDGTAGGDNITVGPGVTIDPSERLFKWGWVGDSLQLVNWVARVNVAGVDIHNAIFRDTLGYGQVLINNDPNWSSHNVWVAVGHWVEGVWVSLGGFHPYDHGRLTVGDDGTYFEIDLGNLVRGASTVMTAIGNCGSCWSSPGVTQNGVSLMIYYTTRITDGGAAAGITGYDNSAVLSGNGIRTERITVWTPIVGGGGNPGGFSFDFFAYKEVYGIGSLSNPAVFEFEFIDTTADPNRVVAWGRVEIAERGALGRQPITFYFDDAFSDPVTSWQHILRNGREYKLIEVSHPDFDVSYLGVNTLPGTDNEFRVSNAIPSVSITVTNRERSTNGQNDPPRRPGGGGGTGRPPTAVPTDPTDPTDPIEPILPIGPEDPVNPVEPILPIEYTEPIEYPVPTGPSDLREPTDTAIYLEEASREPAQRTGTLAPQTSDATQLPWLPLIFSVLGLLAVGYIVRRKL